MQALIFLACHFPDDLYLCRSSLGEILEFVKVERQILII
jgi:hypothetical protein